MPNEQDSREFDRMAAAPSMVINVPPRPTIPDALKRVPAHKKAWTEYEKKEETWRKGVNFQLQASLGAVAGSTSVRTSSGARTVLVQATTPTPTTLPPALDADLHALYLASLMEI